MPNPNLHIPRHAMVILMGAAFLWLLLQPRPAATFPTTLAQDGVPQATLRISPPELAAAVASGEVTTQTLRLSNSNSITLTFEISESPLVQPAPQPGFLTRKRMPQVLATPGNASAPPKWAPLGYTSGQVVTGTPRILLYTDDFFTGPGATYPEQALQALDLPFTAYYADPNGFLRALQAGTPWDLVLISHNERLAGGAMWPAVEAYLAGGGRVIVETFDIDGSHSLPTALWTLCDVLPAGDLQDPAPLFAWMAEHSVFTQPVEVPSGAQFENLYLDDGDRLRVLNDALALAGFTPRPAPDQAAIVLGAQGRCLVNSFIISTNPDDRNGDGFLDGVALWINEISLMAREFIDVPWLRVTPVRGSLAPGASIEIAVTLDASALQPGRYEARLIVRTDGEPPAAGIPVVVDVGRTAEMTRITGLVLDAATGDPLRAQVHAMSTPYVVETSPQRGWFYNLWLRPGTYTLEARAEGYYPERQVVEVPPGDVISVGFLLRRQGWYVLPILRNWP